MCQGLNQLMNHVTTQKLLKVNREFYQTFAAHFSATRLRIQPGVKNVIDNLPTNINILDLGCGNGNVAKVLNEMGFKGQYLGLDFSPELLNFANRTLKNQSNFSFIQGDLASMDWEKKFLEFSNSLTTESKFNVVLSFATFHHLPGEDLRIRTLKKIHALLSKGGKLYHSNWQFLNSERLRKRIQPWQLIDLGPEGVDSGDYLLDWRQGGHGLRYVHHFGQDELFALAEQTDFNVVETYFSDGEEGNLGLYQVWEKN